jgi:hypothetical protein
MGLEGLLTPVSNCWQIVNGTLTRSETWTKSLDVVIT